MYNDEFKETHNVMTFKIYQVDLQKWRHSRGVLSRGHRAYVVNSKSNCELLTLYYYKTSLKLCLNFCWEKKTILWLF